MYGRYCAYLLFMLAVSLTGCISTSSRTSEPSTDVPSGKPWYYSGWISKNQDEIARQAQAFIHSRHPQVDPDFPDLHIRKVAVVDVNPDDQDMRQMLQSLSDSILGKRPGAPTWDADVTVSFHEHDPSQATQLAMMVPEFVVCFSTIFVVCPEHTTEEVQIEVHVVTPDGRESRFVSAGYGDLYMQSMLLGDDYQMVKDKTLERNTGALIAAIVGAADKLVDTYKTLHGNAAQGAAH